MASIIKASINLSQVPKDKIIVGQSKEERDAKTAKTYLGNVKVVWTNGDNVEPAPRDGADAPPPPRPVVQDESVDLPF